MFTGVAKIFVKGKTCLLYAIKPFSDESDVLLALLPHWSVTRVLEGHPLGLFDLPEVIRSDKVLSEILTTVNDERRNADFVQFIGDVPSIQGTGEPTRCNPGQYWRVRGSGKG